MPEDINFDVAEDCDYNHLKRAIAAVLRKYYEYDDDGVPTKEYDKDFSAQDALDEIHEIVGEI